MTHILAQQLRERADWFKRERENGGDAAHLSAREVECRHIALLADREGERVTVELKAAMDKHLQEMKAIVDRHGAMPPLNADLIAILGRPNFHCAPIAWALRDLLGHTIERKAEHEQAAVIHWLLGLYLEHGAQCFDRAEAILKTAKAAHDAAVEAQAKRVE